MIAHAKLAAIKGIRPHEWAIRFLFGGGVCVIAGLIASRFGPAVGGLFLAFPAIFPAGASLVEAHERKHKARTGYDGTGRGRAVAGLDAAGTAIGCIGLASFAIICSQFLTRLPSWEVFALATFAWLTVSIALWWIRKSRLFRTRRHRALRAFRAS